MTACSPQAKVLPISGDAYDKDRTAQHQTVTGTARSADTGIIAYTSALGPLTAELADAHRQS
ncbi:hypothetical protein ACIPSJ_51685 [Streptomyces sp. NPDC090088]|uniref:hypothetical protein n=1 Tax=Streptomyces sp. NPDC090088 TaxID=3365944 RepID=UPI003815B835